MMNEMNLLRQPANIEGGTVEVRLTGQRWRPFMVTRRVNGLVYKTSFCTMQKALAYFNETKGG